MQARSRRWRGFMALAGCVLAAGGLTLAWPALVRAVDAGAAAARGIAISPFYSDIEIGASDKQATTAITLTNGSAAEQHFRLTAVDFGSLDEEGGVAFLGQSANELDRKYGLAAWMSVDQTNVVVPAGASQAIKVTITNRDDLAPGGHYGAVLATALTDGSDDPNDPHVGVRQVLSSLLFVTKDGQTQTKLTLASQTHDGQWWRIPRHIVQRFSNQGNVHVVPRGVIEVRDPMNRVIASNAINDASSIVLPGAIRKIRTDLDVLAPAWLPGPYRLVSSYRPDGADAITTSVQVVWYGGALVLWVVVLGAGLAIWGLVWWLWRRPRRSN